PCQRRQLDVLRLRPSAQPPYPPVEEAGERSLARSHGSALRPGQRAMHPSVAERADRDAHLQGAIPVAVCEHDLVDRIEPDQRTVSHLRAPFSIGRYTSGYALVM